MNNKSQINIAKLLFQVLKNEPYHVGDLNTELPNLENKTLPWHLVNKQAKNSENTSSPGSTRYYCCIQNLFQYRSEGKM